MNSPDYRIFLPLYSSHSPSLLNPISPQQQQQQQTYLTFASFPSFISLTGDSYPSQQNFPSPFSTPISNKQNVSPLSSLLSHIDLDPHKKRGMDFSGTLELNNKLIIMRDDCSPLLEKKNLLPRLWFEPSPGSEEPNLVNIPNSDSDSRTTTPNLPTTPVSKKVSPPPTTTSPSSRSRRQYLEKVSLESRLDGFKGEKRLHLRVECFGVIGDIPQTCGHGGTTIIPDGLVTISTVYNQQWRFEIHHTAPLTTKKHICIKWVAINLISKLQLELTETVQESERRNSRGWTIANKMFRRIMEARAKELEQLLVGETNPTRISNYRSLITNLRPKLFCEGLLVFGLQHRIIQEEMVRQLK